jgi:hypothetical protein
MNLIIISRECGEDDKYMHHIVFSDFKKVENYSEFGNLEEVSGWVCHTAAINRAISIYGSAKGK